MTAITDVRDAVATALTNVPGLRVSSTVLDAIEPPCAVVGEVEIDFDQAFGRGVDLIRVKSRLYASRADVKTGQRTLDAFLATSGPQSVKAVLEADRTLGGVVETSIVTGVSGYGAYEVGSVLYLGAEFAMNVWVKGL